MNHPSYIKESNRKQPSCFHHAIPSCHYMEEEQEEEEEEEKEKEQPQGEEEEN